MTRWPRGNASDSGARGPVFNFRLWQRFLCLPFCFVVVFYFFVQNKCKFSCDSLNIVFLCVIYCVTNAVAVRYRRNISMAEKRIVCFQSKTVKICSFFISNNYNIYLKKSFKIFVTNDFLAYSVAQLL